MVPLQLYFSHGLVKCKLALATGKKIYDKRRTLVRQAAKQDIDQAMKDRNQ